MKQYKQQHKFLFAVLLIILAIGLAYRVNLLEGVSEHTLPSKVVPVTIPTKVKFELDKNAQAGVAGRSKAEITADLNKRVENGYLDASFNRRPVFANGRAKGNLLITNKSANHYPIMVKIYNDANGQLIYSGGVDVGQKIETSTLAVDLPKGVYTCTALFMYVDVATSTRIGFVPVKKLKIYVLS